MTTLTIIGIVVYVLFGAVFYGMTHQAATAKIKAKGGTALPAWLGLSMIVLFLAAWPIVLAVGIGVALMKGDA